MDMTPANSEEQLDQARISHYIQHLRDLYAAKQTRVFREPLIPEAKPCTLSLTRLMRLPLGRGESEAEKPCWQLICLTSTEYNTPLKKKYYFTDDGQLRFLRENVGTCTIIELDAHEAFVSWEQYDWLPEDGLGWNWYTCVYDENGEIVDDDWHGQA